MDSHSPSCSKPIPPGVGDWLCSGTSPPGRGHNWSKPRPNRDGDWLCSGTSPPGRGHTWSKPMPLGAGDGYALAWQQIKAPALPQCHRHYEWHLIVVKLSQGNSEKMFWASAKSFLGFLQNVCYFWMARQQIKALALPQCHRHYEWQMIVVFWASAKCFWVSAKCWLFSERKN